jgi:NADH dehydrogenase [ubiquinone] 1 alpha subcomplex assembly factor 7
VGGVGEGRSGEGRSGEGRSGEGTAPAQRLARLIRREGPVRFDTFVEEALYGEGGFFASGRGAGRGVGGTGGDFITSPEVGPIFGALVGEALDRWWDALECPDPYLVVEAGAGRGRLASDVMRAGPRCLRALRYVLVERSATLRDAQRALLRLEPPDEAFGPYVAGPEAPEPVRESGPVMTSLDDLPGVEFEGVVLANELLDNLPFGIACFTGSAWAEVRVGLDRAGDFVEVVVPALPADSAALARVTAGLSPAVGDRLPVPHGLDDWLRRVAAAQRRGYVVLLDTMDTAAGMLARGSDGWLRTYRGHAPGGPPLTDPGSRDLVADVVIEQVRHAAVDAGFVVLAETTQSAWLEELGLAGLLDEGRRLWEERAAIGDLAALEARSRATQAAALTEPAGLGGHHVVVLGRHLR